MKCLVTMMAAALTLAAVAQESGRVKPRRGSSGMSDPIVRAALNPAVAEKIGLTAEQQAKLKELTNDTAEQKALQEKMRKGMARQVELLAAEKIDEAAVMATVDEVFEARKEIAKSQMKRLISVKSILTPEQVKSATEALRAIKEAKRAAGAAGQDADSPKKEKKPSRKRPKAKPIEKAAE